MDYLIPKTKCDKRYITLLLKKIKLITYIIMFYTVYDWIYLTDCG